MKKEIYRGAVVGIIRDGKGNVLYGKRKGTGYNDGFYQLPGGHIDSFFEDPKDALKREMLEELGITVSDSDIELVALARTTRKKQGNTYFSFYFEVKNFSGELVNAEPDKCEKIAFLNHKIDTEIPFSNLGPTILEKIEKGIFYSDFDIEDVE